MDDVNPRVAADPTDLEALATKIHDMLRANPASSPAHRALHARGHLVGGTFTPSGAVGDLTAASVLTGGPVDVVARFSDASGDPHQHDARPDGRGLAVKLRHPDGTYDLVGVTSPAFVVRDGASFVEALEARRPDPATGAPDPARMMAFLEAHPEAGTAVGFAMSAPVPASFATLRFNGLHTFLFVGPDGARHPFRYHWEPAAGEAGLAPEEAADREPGFLGAELAARLADGPVAFDLVVHLGEAGDPLDDPTAVWPERPTRVAGRLELAALVEEEQPVIFDPTNVPAGVELTDDEILQLRRSVYGLSYATRTAP